MTDPRCGRCGAAPSPGNPQTRWFLHTDPTAVRCDFCHPYGYKSDRVNPNCTCAAEAPTMPVARAYDDHTASCFLRSPTH